MQQTANVSTVTFLSEASTLTLRCVLEVAMITREFSRLPHAWLDKMAENGRAHTNEVKHMARELIEAREEIERLRAKLDAEAATRYNPYIDFVGGP